MMMMSEFSSLFCSEALRSGHGLTFLSSSDDDSDDEDDTAALMAELAKIKQERAEEKARLVRPIPLPLSYLSGN